MCYLNISCTHITMWKMDANAVEEVKINRNFALSYIKCLQCTPLFTNREAWHNSRTLIQRKVDDDDRIDRLIVTGSVTLTVSMILFDRAFNDTFRHQGHPFILQRCVFLFFFFFFYNSKRRLIETCSQYPDRQTRSFLDPFVAFLCRILACDSGK